MRKITFTKFRNNGAIDFLLGASTKNYVVIIVIIFLLLLLLL